MSNLFFTGFEGITDASDVGFGANTVDGTGGRFGNGMRGGGDYRKDITANVNTVFAGAALYGTLPGSSATLFSIRDSSGTVHCTVLVLSTGAVRLDAGAATGVATSAAGVIASATWFYCEVKVLVHDSTGILECRINGTVVATFSGDTRNGGTAEVGRVHLCDNFASNRVDDVYINDDQGSAPHNTYYGDIRVDRVLTSADSSVQFTPLSSTNESNIDDTTPDDDTTYNQSSTAGHKDLFTLSGYSPGGGTILCIKTRVKAKKTDAGTRDFRSLLKSGATTSNGSTVGMSTSFAWFEQYDYEDPDTAAAWANAAAVNAALVGYEIVT